MRDRGETNYSLSGLDDMKDQEEECREADEKEELEAALYEQSTHWHPASAGRVEWCLACGSRSR